MFRSAIIALSLACVAGHVSAAKAQDQKPAPELVQYIRDAEKAGLAGAQIRQNAVKAGWAVEMVEAAMGPSDAKPGGIPPDIAKMASKQDPSGPAIATEGGGGTTKAQPGSTGAKTTETKAGEAEGVAAGKTPNASVRNPDAESLRAKSATSNETEYQIGEGDIIQIAVWGEPTASVQSVTVRTDGKISMPLIKEVQVAGQTPAQVEATIQEQLSKVIKAPDVTVIVVQINSKKIYLTGAVKREGPLKYTYRMTVLQAISEAGGLTDYAKRKKIYVLHHENGREYKLPFDYTAVLKGERMEQNIYLSPGDHIVIP
jgi:polysaccharide export outer membrane protein